MIERGREDHGLPHETFEIGVPDSVSEAAESKMEEIEQEYAESKVVENGEIPRLKESGVPTRMLKVMYDEGMSPWQIQKWMPDSVYSMDVKAGILYQCKREKEQAEKHIETASVNSNRSEGGTE